MCFLRTNECNLAFSADSLNNIWFHGLFDSLLRLAHSLFKLLFAIFSRFLIAKVRRKKVSLKGRGAKPGSVTRTSIRQRRMILSSESHKATLAVKMSWK